MAKTKACSKCRIIFEGDKCPTCNEIASNDGFKGRVYIFNPEESKIAKKMKLPKKGEFAIKTK